MTTGNLVQNGMQQFFDNNGDPLAAGYVYTYVVGTTTPLATYQDAALTVVNTNPVRLDGAGRAMIYASSALRQVVKTANGVTVWDTPTQSALSVGQVTSNLATIAALRANTAAVASYYVQGYYDTGDGGEGIFNLVASDTTSADNGGTIIVDAGGRRYYRDLGPDKTVVSALQFGARGDNSTDDTTALRAALATTLSVFLPGGRNYRTTGALTLNQDGQRLFGEGPIRSTITPSGNFNVIQGGVNKQYQGVSNLNFDCTGMTGGATIYTNRTNRFYVSGLDIYKPWITFEVYDTNLGEFSTCSVQDPQGPYGIYLHGTDNSDRSDVIRLIDLNFGGSQAAGSRTWTGIYWDGMVNTVESYSCTFVNAMRGLHIVNSSGSSIYRPLFGIFHDFECDFSDQEGVRIEAGEGFWFTSLYTQAAAYSTGVYVGANAASVKITNGYVRGCLKEGAEIGGQDCAFNNVEFCFNSFPLVMIYDGVKILGTANRIQFTGCMFGGLKGVGSVSRYGCSVDNGALSVRFAACDFYGCALGPLLDNSGSTHPGNVEIVGSGASEYNMDNLPAGFRLGCQNGYGCVLTPTVVAGAITAVAVTNGGANYSAAPALVAVDPANTGSGFVGTATINGSGVVTGVAVSNGGSGYSANVLIVPISTTSFPTLQAFYPGQTDTPAFVAANGSSFVGLKNAYGTAFAAQALDASAVNFLTARSRSTGSTPDLIANGPDTNINIGLFPKGTGKLWLGGPTAGSAGALSAYLQVIYNGSTFNIPLYNP